MENESAQFKASTGVILDSTYLDTKDAKGDAQTALRRSGEVSDLFGKVSETPKCYFCGGEFVRRRKRQKFCTKRCKDLFRVRKRHEVKSNLQQKRHAKTLAWIAEHEGVIQSIIGSALADKQKGMVKGSFRRYWENVKLQFPNLPFNNDHIGFVNRYIQENVPELAGYFRTRGE